MTSVKKFTLKRIVVVIITAVVLFSALSFGATKLIYDGIFQRYDETVPVPAALQTMVQQRQTVSYPSGEYQLTGHLYRSTQGGGLVVWIPGFHAGADSYLWQIQSLLERGWSVFAFDPTGSCASEGKDQVGFAQILQDLEATLKYVENTEYFGYNELVLLGHSRGGYAAACALQSGYKIDAVVTVSAVDSTMDGVMSRAVEQAGPLVYGNYGFLWLYQTLLFGAQQVDLRASDCVAASDVPVLVIHGAADRQVPMDRYSLISHRDQITAPQVQYLIWDQPGSSGHTDLLFDQQGRANADLMAQICRFLKQST